MSFPFKSFAKCCIFVSLFLIYHLLWFEPAFAQGSPFLISPYYGEETISQNYGTSHKAIDYGLGYERVIASASGTVDFVGWWNNNSTGGTGCHQSGTWPNDDNNCGFGLHARINYGNNYRSWYAHLSAVAFAMGTPNASISQGQILGTSGHTGWSTDPHLHFQTQKFIDNTWLNNEVNPADPNLWQDGQWANPSRPIPQPVDGQITATVSSEAGEAGGFYKGPGAVDQNPCTSSACGYWTSGGSYFYIDVGGNASWAKWQPTNLITGIYEIQVLIPSNNATTWQAPYKVRQGGVGGSVLITATVDQSGLYNQWVSIGTSFLKPGANVYVTDATGETGRQIAADDVRFIRRGTTYAPDVRSSGGWVSTVYLRSNGGTAQFLLKCLNSSGQSVYETVDTLAAHAVTTPVCLVSGYSSVVVDASQDISLVVENRKTGESTNYSGIPAGNGSTGWDSTGITLYIPTLKYGLYSRSGRIYLLNAGTTTTNITIDLWRQDSNVHYSCGTSLVAQGRTTIDPAGCGGAVAGYLYGAKITSVSTGGSDPVDPLAAVVVEKNDSGAELQASTNAFAFGNGTNYSPLVKNSYWGNQATMVVQNVGSATTNVYVTYYYSGTTSTTTFNNLPSGSSHIFAPQIGGVPPVPTGTLASVRTTSSGQPLVTALYENKTGASWRMQHSGFTSGSKVVILPRLAKNYNDGSLIWQSGYLVQNVGTVNTTVTVKYYNMDGTYAGNTPSFSVQPNRSYVVNVTNNSTMSSPWQGSALVVADQPIVISGNLTNNGSGDAAMSYSGVNR